jgi:protein-tyrosine phosphatase
MFDIHHHLLPGLDDGSPDLQTSLAMAQIAVEDGITHAVCTPHASSQFAFQPEENARLIAELRAALAAESIPLTITQGCDFPLNSANIQDALANPRKYTIGGHNFLLVELPDFSFPPKLSDTYYQLRVAGMTPILTHPERNATLQRDETKLKEWVEAGMLVQVTAGSVTGDMGKNAQRMAESLLERRWVHFLATDAHNTTRRPPRMSAARAIVAERYGEAYATLLCETNPKAVFEGHRLPAQPEPRGLFDDDFQGGGKRPGLLQRLFGKGR